MIPFMERFNLIILCLFLLCYFYQIAYIVVRFVKKQKDHPAQKQHKFAILISARNEEKVIGELLRSIRNQRYPRELIDVYVVADNCDDNTARIARKYGATVFERANRRQVGKGYALDYAFGQIRRSVGIRHYEAYMVFDADNVLDENYVHEMNKTFDQGYGVITSYRNSKNYGTNWISAGYALWFLRESQYLNGARMSLHTSCAISGTGFLVSSRVIEQNGGWKHHLLTEDIEFSIDSAIRGEVIGYCERAIVYDEQPQDFRSSWKQRMRWAKGFYQVFARYGRALVGGCVKQRSFQCYDMLMTIAPATLLTLTTIAANLAFCVYGFATKMPEVVAAAGQEAFITVAGVYLSLFLFGLVTTITEWRQIHCAGHKKILYLFTFPVFMFTYVPIAIAALFKHVTWEPIAHTVQKNVQEIRE